MIEARVPTNPHDIKIGAALIRRHASSKLTLNLGVRYDVFTPFTEVNNALSNFDPATGTIIAAGQNGVNDYAGLHTTWTNVAPRVGFAYTFLPSWIVRGGFGLSFVPENYTSNASLKNQPFVSSVLCQNGSCPNNITQFQQGSAAGHPIQCNQSERPDCRYA